MSGQHYEPRRVKFTVNSQTDKFPTATLKRLGLPPSPKALGLVDMNGPFQGTVGGRATLRGDRVLPALDGQKPHGRGDRPTPLTPSCASR
jgi:hypothetical protein